MLLSTEADIIDTSSGCMWLMFKLVTILIDHKNNHDAVLIMGVITNMCVAISIASALPWVRNTHRK
jgi:nicotinamidase-related amidase